MEKIGLLSVSELSKKLSLKEISALEVAESYFDEIAIADKDIKAYITLTEESAFKQAREIDERRVKGNALTTLAGVPMALKDNICTKGIRTTCASKILEDFCPPYDASVVERLRESGAILLGKTNLDEFAMGSSGENSAFFVTRNPHDPDRVPGGSSGGSAAAVAGNLAPFALGSDTGGSIRQPAAFCGVVGMKPTYGSVSRYGLIAFASSLDQIGPITKNVGDCAIVLNAIVGHDRRDSTSKKRNYSDFTKDICDGAKGMRIALPDELMGEGISAEVKETIFKAAKIYESLGAVVETVSMPALPAALPAYYLLSSSEASSNLARYDGIGYGYRAAEYEDIDALYSKSRSEGFGREVKRRIMLGTFALSAGYYDAYYKKSLSVRSLVIADFRRIFKDFDLILSPVTPTTAYKFGEKIGDPISMYADDLCTVPVNIAGLPAISLPCGAGENELPIGMQLIGNAFDEKKILRAAKAFEDERGTFDRIRKEAAR